MSDQQQFEIVIAVLKYAAVPWCVWCTLSIFNQRQEIALLKQLVAQISLAHKDQD